MKGKKNLEKAIVVGLLLSTSVYGTAWAAPEISEDGNTITFNPKFIEDVYDEDGKFSYHKYEDQLISEENHVLYAGKEINEFENIIINFTPQHDGFRANDPYSFRLTAPDTNVTITVNESSTENNDGIHLTNWNPHFVVKNYTANINSYNSDALNISHDSTKAYATIYGDLTVDVKYGNGIRANSQTRSSNPEDLGANITVSGKTTINIYGENIKNTVTIEHKTDDTPEGAITLESIFGDKTISFSGMTVKIADAVESVSANTKYNPAAVYAGDDQYNFKLGSLLNNYLESQEGINGLIDSLGLRGQIDNIVNSFNQKNTGGESKGEGIVELGDTEIGLHGNNQQGIFAGKNGHINVKGSLDIQSFGDNSFGLSAKNANLIYGDFINTNIYFTDEFKQKLKDELGFQGTALVFAIEEFLEAEEGMMCPGVLDESKNIHGTSITLGENTDVLINMQGDNSKAIYASGIDDSSEQNQNSVSGKNLNSLWVKGDIVAEDGGVIDLHVTANAEDVVNGIDGNILAQGKGVNSETAAYCAKANDSKNATVNLTVDGELSGQGTLAAANGGTVNVVLGDRSNWAGRADDYQDAGSANWDHTQIENAFGEDTVINNSGTVNLTLGNEAFWNVTGQSWITNLTGNNSIIILDSENTNGHALHVGEVNGSNTFVMNVRPDETGDMLYVKNGTGDTQHLVINNANEVLENMVKGDAVRFATIKNSGGGFNDDSNISDDSVLSKNNIQTFGSNTRISDAGMFNVDFAIVYNDYNEKMDGDLAAEDENSTVADINDVYNGNGFDTNKPGSKYVDEVYGGNTDDTTTNSIAEADEESNPVNAYIVRKSVTKDNLSDAGKTIINMSRANYKNAIYMDRLNKRLGEVRYINGEEEQGMWVRLRHDRIGMDSEFRSQNTMYELGYDVKQECDNGERRLGFAVDYMDGSTTYSDIIGKGETKRYGLWLYDTWLGDKGHYADYVLKWGHLQNDFDIKSKTRFEDISGDYSNNVFSVSAEYGKKNDMGNNWYFEPQAQLQLARVTGAEYESTQNTKVSVDGINSLIGRAGFRLGRDLNENSTVYVKADLLHEFLGDQTITASDPTGTFRETFENKGTWYDVGFGFATAVGKNSYAFMDFEKSFGNDNDETYQINAGVQWTF
mgnify:CR=1 FL=1